MKYMVIFNIVIVENDSNLSHILKKIMNWYNVSLYKRFLHLQPLCYMII